MTEITLTLTKRGNEILVIFCKFFSNERKHFSKIIALLEKNAFLVTIE